MIKLSPEILTPAIQVCNEDHWAYYTVRDLYAIFPEIIVLDTGSDDLTKEIIKTEFPKVTLIEEAYGHDDNKIGNGRNVMREACKTHFMFIADSDEVWRTNNILKIFEHEVPDDTGVVMLGLANVEDIGDRKLKLRTHDYSNRDGLFSPDIRWHKTDYPFESYGLSGGFPVERVHYLNAHEVYAWHMRHTIRSTRNDAVYFRNKKYGFFPYSGEYSELPEGWIGEINHRWPNFYLHD